MKLLADLGTFQCIGLKLKELLARKAWVVGALGIVVALGIRVTWVTWSDELPPLSQEDTEDSTGLAWVDMILLSVGMWTAVLVVLISAVHAWIWQRRALAVLMLAIWPAAFLYAVLVAWNRVPRFGYRD